MEVSGDGDRGGSGVGSSDGCGGAVGDRNGTGGVGETTAAALAVMPATAI
ncbi:hypothetical protein Hanom_Chr09g00787271 [Helianthus anomalus]